TNYDKGVALSGQRLAMKVTVWPSVIANDASSARLCGFASTQQALVPPVENKCQSLMSYTKHTSRASNAAIRNLERLLNQITFVSKYFFFERARQIQGGFCGAILSKVGLI